MGYLESVTERYLNGVPWTETIIFQKKLALIEAGRRVDGCTSREQLLQRCDRLDRLYRILQTEPYRCDLLPDGRPSLDNVSVSIGRDGVFFFVHGGGHRLAMAKVLNLPEIPCLVIMRHRDWQDRLEQVGAGLARDDRVDIGDHPDLHWARTLAAPPERRRASS